MIEPYSITEWNYITQDKIFREMIRKNPLSGYVYRIFWDYCGANRTEVFRGCFTEDELAEQVRVWIGFSRKQVSGAFKPIWESGLARFENGELWVFGSKKKHWNPRYQRWSEEYGKSDSKCQAPDKDRPANVKRLTKSAPNRTEQNRTEQNGTNPPVSYGQDDQYGTEPPARDSESDRTASLAPEDGGSFGEEPAEPPAETPTRKPPARFRSGKEPPAQPKRKPGVITPDEERLLLDLSQAIARKAEQLTGEILRRLFPTLNGGADDLKVTPENLLLYAYTALIEGDNPTALFVEFCQTRRPDLHGTKRYAELRRILYGVEG